MEYMREASEKMVDGVVEWFEDVVCEGLAP